MNVEQGGKQFRLLKATIPEIEFGSAQWAAKRAGRSASGGVAAMPLAEFMREALRDKVRAVVRQEIARGKGVPADIAAVMSGTPSF